MGKRKEGPVDLSTNPARTPFVWTTARVAGLVAAVAVVAVGGGVLLGRTSPASTHVAVAGEATSAAPAGATSGSARAAAPGAGTSGAATPSSADGSSGDAAPAAKGRDVPVAVTGSALATVPSAPGMTISELKVPQGFTPVTCDAVFEPYGWAPDGPQGKRIAVRVIAWDAKGAKDIKDLAGRNALFYVTGTAVPDQGGRYQGRVELKGAEDGRAGLFLSSAHLSK